VPVARRRRPYYARRSVGSVLSLDAASSTPLLEAGPEGRLGAARTVGDAAGRTGAATAWVLIEDGVGCLGAGDASVDVQGRADVFVGPGWSACIGPDTDFSLSGTLRATIVWRECARDVATRLIDPATVSDEARGEGTTARRVRTYIAEGPLIVGETLNPPGGWSSWPPHRHEHEELYLYRFAPEHGFGVHVGFDDQPVGRQSTRSAIDAPVIVRDGSIERITDGWHPVVAAPDCQMYYLWALAGDADTVATVFHDDYS
jgi:5-deoxy-D-glucuronate isomerase